MDFARRARRLGWATLAAALLAALALPSAGASAAASGGDPSGGPTCAEGPVREGDTIRGTPCADTIVAPETVTRVNGGGGDDTIVAAAAATPTPFAAGVCEPLCGVGSQVFEGGPGDDVVFGERGNDILRGNGGNDRLYGGTGDDTLEGGPGDDLLSGGFGADEIDGGEGSDYVRGDGTIDQIRDSGGPGDVDTLSYASGVTPGFGGGIETGAEGFPAGASGERGVNLVLGNSGLNGNNGSARDGGGWDEVQPGAFETIVGTAFSDYIVGTTAAETIYGGGGADVIEGGGGEDHLFGGADGDLLKAGGDPGDSADGGSGTDNCLGAEVETSCEGTAEAVEPRDPAKVAVGLLAPGTPLAQLYLAGSEGDDEVTASYSPGTPATVTFTLAAGTFDESSAAESGCTFGAGEVTCPLAAPLDSIVLAGMGGDDRLTATGFPQDVGVAVLGGEGADEATGGADSEDLLVGGVDAQPDVLSGLGRDDVLIHEGGPDRLLGGDGNDLFLSTSVCDGEEIVGGDGSYRDSASWAKADEAVAVYLATGVVGRPGQAGCGAEPNDSLTGIEDLEGSEFGDVLIGDAGDNQLLGRAGADFYAAGAGEDTILANSGDSDAAIGCGAGLDTAIIDLPQYGDPEPVECETVRQGAPGDFRHTELLSSPPEPEPQPPPDTTPPRTRFSHHPRKVVFSGRRHRRVAFRFAASEPGSRFLCKLDRKPYRPCRSPRVFGVFVGRHAVRVRAVDAAGNVDSTPALFRFRVRLRVKHHSHHHHVRRRQAAR